MSSNFENNNNSILEDTPHSIAVEERRKKKDAEVNKITRAGRRIKSKKIEKVGPRRIKSPEDGSLLKKNKIILSLLLASGLTVSTVLGMINNDETINKETNNRTHDALQESEKSMIKSIQDSLESLIAGPHTDEENNPHTIVIEAVDDDIVDLVELDDKNVSDANVDFSSFDGGVSYEFNGEETDQIFIDSAFGKAVNRQYQLDNIKETGYPRNEISGWNLIRYESDNYNFDLKSVKAMQNYWIKQFSTSNKKKFDNAYDAINDLGDKIGGKFVSLGVPEEYKYLAIPESYFDSGARSKVGARGAYQFMPGTAKMYNLIDRDDPIKSAEACAKLLRDLFRSFNDWDLAVSAYNSGKPFAYHKEAKKKGDEITYEGYLTYLGEKVEKIKTDIDSGKIKYIRHKVRKGQSIGKIAKRFDVDLVYLKTYNNIGKKNQINIGQRLKIPVMESNKEIIFNKLVANYRENIEYASKINAAVLLSFQMTEEQKDVMIAANN